MTGPQSRALKFSPTMCKQCNNIRSKPFDDAYDRFISYVDAHAHVILASNEISLSNVYGEGWEAQRDDLTRYYVKHICCRLAEPDNAFPIAIDPQLIAYLDGGPEPTCLELDLYVESVYLRIWRIFKRENDPVNLPAGFFGFGPILGQLDPQTNAFSSPQSYLAYAWLWLAWKVGDSGFSSPFSSEVVLLRRKTTMPWQTRAFLAFAETRSRAAMLRHKLGL
jgi:hypothetical protein